MDNEKKLTVSEADQLLTEGFEAMEALLEKGIEEIDLGPEPIDESVDVLEVKKLMKDLDEELRTIHLEELEKEGEMEGRISEI